MREQNLELLGRLEAKKDAIEEVFGAPLSWEPLPRKRACRIAAYGEGDVLDIVQHDEYIDWFLEASARLRAALEPYF